MKRIINFFKRMKPKSKYILGILAIAAIVSQGVFAFTKLSANSPRFNYMQGDYELFRGANKTAGESVWKDPISGNVGDTFKGIIYYHNGMVDTVAENTRIKVTIPAQTTNKSATLSAQISADNAEAVTNTVVDGQIVGLSGLTANLDQDTGLELVPGSVRWYPDQQNNPDIPVLLPYGQSGDEVISANGLNIGNINGCWEYAGYLIFEFRTKAETTPVINVDKVVRNVTAGETSYKNSTNASANDEVEFKVVSINNGTAVANNVNIKDALPGELTFASGSMKLYRDGLETPEVLSDAIASQIFASGWSMGNLQVGSSKADTLVFSAKTPASINEAQTVTNVAEVTSCSLHDSDDANVNFIPDNTPNIVLHKSATNLTSGQIASNREVNGRTVLALDALAGEHIEYTLITQNTGNAVASNYQIQDGIADILEYADIVSVSDSGEVIDGTTGNESKLVSYLPINIDAGSTIYRTFKVQVKNPIPNNPQNGYSYDMQLYNKYGDEVVVVLSIPTPPTAPVLNIEKLVRDYTINQIDFVDQNEAIAGDTLEYLIRFSNSGNSPADLVKFTDVLPANTQYISGTTIISVNGEIERTLPDGIVSDGVTIDTISPSDSGYIKFKVITMAGIPAGQVLVNTAYLTDNGISISDTARTIFKAPVIPAVVSVTPQLPKSGAETIVLSALAALTLLGLAYRVAKYF